MTGSVCLDSVVAALARESGLRTWDARVWLLPGLWGPPEPGSNQCSLHEQVGSQPLNHKASPIFCTSVPQSNILLSSEKP